MKSLDIKLKKISDGSSTAKDFIIADAKDADMGCVEVRQACLEIKMVLNLINLILFKTILTKCNL